MSQARDSTLRFCLVLRLRRRRNEGKKIIFVKQSPREAAGW